jgi:putative phosphonate metabolism protein
MKTYQRYAVYYTTTGPLAEFGAAWLGWDVARGERVDHPDLPGIGGDVATLTDEARKYGFHATIKPPFHLARDQGVADLAAAFARFCKAQAPVRLEGLRLASLHGFLALVPDGEVADLADLAFAAVKELDTFRAPLSEADLARRRAVGLTPDQEALLATWGYPYVGQEFRFHMTLSHRLAEPQRTAVMAALSPAVEPLLPQPFIIDALSLCAADATGRFRVLHRAPLSG